MKNDRQPAVWFPAVRCGSGADVFTKRLCNGLNAIGIRAEITWLPLRAEYAPWTVPIPKPPAWANIVHINSWLHPRFLPQELPVVATLHLCVHDSGLIPYKSRLQALYHRHWIYSIESVNLHHARCVIAVSRYTAKQAKAAFDIDEIEVIYNGVDCKRFTPAQRDKPHSPFRLLYVGNWSVRKGVELLAPIMKNLGHNFKLYYTADRQGRHNRYPLPTNSLNLGRLSGEALIRSYRQADALLFPSRLEGLPLTVLEAMACGLPVIAADVSSLPELIQHRVTGWLAMDHTPSAFADGARAIASDPIRWKAMCQAARQSAVKFFSEERQQEKYVKLYLDVLSREKFYS